MHTYHNLCRRNVLFISIKRRKASVQSFIKKAARQPVSNFEKQENLPYLLGALRLPLPLRLS